MRRLVAVVLPLVVAPLVGIAGASPASASTKHPYCDSNSVYGTSCIDLQGTGLQLTDVIGYFVPPNRDYYSHKTWALELTTYSCDPRGLTKKQCPPRHTYYSKKRHGNPPKNGSQCQTLQVGNNFASYAYQDCVDYGLAQEQATHGDWPTFFNFANGKPHTFAKNTWTCMEAAVRHHHHWVDNGPAKSKGFRACAEIKS